MLQAFPASNMASVQWHQASATALDRKAQTEKALEGNLKLRQRLQKTLDELEVCAQENAAVVARLEAAVSSSQAIRCRSRLGEPYLCLLLPGGLLTITHLHDCQLLQQLHLDEAASESPRERCRYLWHSFNWKVHLRALCAFSEGRANRLLHKLFCLRISALLPSGCTSPTEFK